MKVTTFISPSGSLIYVRVTQGKTIKHLTTDEKFLLYRYIRKEIPNLCVLFDTKRELVQNLADQNYHI